MRLIDADALDKVLIDAQEQCKVRGGNFRYGVLSNVRENIRQMPTIEQPKIIRCKDCKWGVNIGYGWYVCRMLVSGKHLGDWYCADAKDGEQENDTLHQNP